MNTSSPFGNRYESIRELYRSIQSASIRDDSHRRAAAARASKAARSVSPTNSIRVERAYCGQYVSGIRALSAASPQQPHLRAVVQEYV